MNAKLLVLLLEDDESVVKSAQRTFAAANVETVVARDVSQAFEAFAKYGNKFDGMYIDAYIKEGNDVTYRFVKAVRQSGYNGPMVTASNEANMNRTLVSCGCSIPSTKGDAPRKLLEALAISK